MFPGTSVSWAPRRARPRSPPPRHFFKKSSSADCHFSLATCTGQRDPLTHGGEARGRGGKGRGGGGAMAAPNEGPPGLGTRGALAEAQRLAELQHAAHQQGARAGGGGEAPAASSSGGAAGLVATRCGARPSFPPPARPPRSG